jgi:hypothetical protein
MTNIGRETLEKYNLLKNECMHFLTFAAYNKVCSQDLQAGHGQIRSKRMVQSPEAFEG